MGNLETSSQTCENINTKKESPEIIDTFNWSIEEREKLNEDILVENLRKKLIKKYPEQKCFFESVTIKVMQLGKNVEEYKQVYDMINTNIFLLYSSDGRLLSYLDQNGNTMLDLVNFDFDNDLMNLLHKKEGNIYIIRNKKNGKLELYDDGKIYKEGSEKFNDYIIIFLPLWDYFK